MKSGDANALYKFAASLFGGFEDPRTGQMAGLKPDVATTVALLAQMAERYLIAGHGHHDAVLLAARELGIEFPRVPGRPEAPGGDGADPLGLFR